MKDYSDKNMLELMATSTELKECVKEDLRKSLIDSGGFDADTVNKIISAFDTVAANYTIRKKKIKLKG